ncbi:MAG: hypothetical protein HYY22_10575 [Thaumarchaeota archaeon]|nr:hypothetical protein [Nitrososphaerota archaeon]
MSMNGGKRVVLSTILGVVLAAAMIISLSTFTTVEQPPRTVQANVAPSDNQSMMKGLAESKPAEQAASQDQWTLELGKTSVTADPTTVGAPFALALLAGVGVFLVVKRRVK